MKATAVSLVSAAAILSTLAVLAPLRAADDPASIIKSRQAMMKDQGGHMKAINTILENGGDVSAIVEHAQALGKSAQRIPALFPEGTGMDDGVGRTGAKAAIWNDWAGFESASQALEEESARLAEMAASGDRAAAAAQFMALGKKGCGGCHTPFRQKLD